MATTAYGIGDWIGDFTLPTQGGETFKLSNVVGRPVILLFFGTDTSQQAEVQQACASVSQHYAILAALNAPVMAVRRAMDSLDGPAAPSANGSLPYPVLLDTSGEVSARYGATRLRAVLLGPAGRVAKYYDEFSNGDLGERLVDDVTLLFNLERPRVVLQQAPILLIPDVLPPEFCKKLIDTWETQGNQDSGFMVSQGEKTVGQYDYNSKIRRDHFIPRGTPLDAEGRQWIGRHIAGELFKTFNYEASRVEDMKIACYDAARGGFFRPHRDNTTGATAHRRFAASILLNDDYEGGYLRFPEYGPHLYRPPAGAAVIFGCSLLHEAMDITAGRRFVLLTFLYGEKEAKAREEYAKKTGGGYRAGAS